MFYILISGVYLRKKKKEQFHRTATPRSRMDTKWRTLPFELSRALLSERGLHPLLTHWHRDDLETFTFQVSSLRTTRPRDDNCFQNSSIHDRRIPFQGTSEQMRGASGAQAGKSIRILSVAYRRSRGIYPFYRTSNYSNPRTNAVAQLQTGRIATETIFSYEVQYIRETLHLSIFPREVVR